MTLAAVGAYGLVLGALAAFSGATELSARLWSPLAAATVLFVALRHLGVPGTAAFVAGLVWGAFPGRLAAGDDPGLRFCFLLPLALLALHRMMAGRRVRHAVEFGALTGLQVALVGPAGLPVVVAAVAAAFGLAAAVGRWRSRTTLAGLAAAALVATAVVGVAVGTGGVAPMALVGSTTPAAGWRGVVVALASVPEGHVLYGDTGLLPTGARFAFPGVVALGLAAWGWQHARALGCAPLALSAASVAVASLAAMAWWVPPQAFGAAVACGLLGLAALSGLGAEALVRAAGLRRRAWLAGLTLALGIALEAWWVEPGRPAERVIYSAHSRSLSPGSGLLPERP